MLRNQVVEHEAFRVAAGLHKGQLRQSGEPYMGHPLMVAHIVAGMRMDLTTSKPGCCTT